MPENTKAQAQRRSQAIVSAIPTALLQCLSAGLLLWVRGNYFPAGPFSVALAALAALDIVMLLPLGVSLWRRLEEIKGGEEDEASQY